MAQSLRVLNAVRDYHIGIPLTYAQYVVDWMIFCNINSFDLRFKRLTPDAVIDILIRRNHHLLAVRIADYLKVRSDKILIHWACAKVRWHLFTLKTSNRPNSHCDRLKHPMKMKRASAELLSTNFTRNPDFHMPKLQRLHTTLDSQDWRQR